MKAAKAGGWLEWVRSEADERAVAAGYWFDIERAEHVREFFRLGLCHSKGAFAGQPFELQEWQWRDLIGPLFGWMRPGKDADGRGLRRFNVGYTEISKKNGKSTLGSGIVLYMLVGDGEPGAEVYSAACDRAQASIIYNESAQMVEASPALKKRLTVTPSTKTIGHQASGSVYRALSADVKTKEGLNIHCLMFDELHAQPNRHMWDTLRFGGAARSQPLILAITTAGWDRDSICYEQYQYAKAVLAGDVEDLNFFGLIYEADEPERWTDEDQWRKANPSLGVTISLDSFRQDCREAQASPVKENAFKRLRLDIWTEQADRWIQMDTWMRACSGVEPVSWFAAKRRELRGRRCWGGLDLGSTSDLTVLVLLFGDDRDGYDLLPFYWIPEDGAQKKESTYRDLYQTWIRQGWVRTTEGDVCDYAVVRADVGELADEFGIEDLAVDRLFQGAQLCTDLMADGLNVVSFGQGFYSMAAPAKRFEELYLKGQLRHGNHPVLCWNAANVSVRTDDAGNMKPIKPEKNSTLKIDGIVATIMALGRAMVAPAPRTPMMANDALRRAMLE